MTCSHLLVGGDHSVVLLLDELVVPVLGSLHPPEEEETEDNEWQPDDGEEEDSNTSSEGGSEDDNGESTEEGIGYEASHSDDDSSSTLDGVSSRGVLDDEEEEHELGQVDDDHHDESNDGNAWHVELCSSQNEESNGVDADPDVDEGPHGDRVDSAHHGEATAASDLPRLVGSLCRGVDYNNGRACRSLNLHS